MFSLLCIYYRQQGYLFHVCLLICPTAVGYFFGWLSMTNPAPALILVKNGSPLTTSLLVAEKFNKRHDTVLRKIDALFGSQNDFARRNFAAIFYKDSYGREQKSYEMTEEGFAMIAMRFTGKKAEEWQILFISQFQNMRKELERQGRMHKDPAWQLVRDETKLGYKWVCETLAERRAAVGKVTKAHHYQNEARLINYVLAGEHKALSRKALSASDLHLISELQRINTMLIAQDIAYQERKAALFNRAALISQQKRLTNG